MMRIERLDRPAVLPVSLAAARDHLRVVHDDDDPQISALIAAAGREFEDAAEIALIDQTIRVILQGWPGGERLVLPVGFVRGDPSHVQVTADGEPIDAHLITGRRPVLVLGETAPHKARVVVEYVAGFGDEPAAIPPDLQHALKDQVLAHFDFSGASPHDGKMHAARGTAGQSYAFQRALARYRGVAI